jgi:hypothetical protein
MLARPPPLFPPAPSFLFPPSTFLYGPIMPYVSTSSTSPCSPCPHRENTTRPVRQMPHRKSPALIRSTPPPSLNRSSLSSSRPTVGLPLAVMLMTCLAPGRPRRGHNAGRRCRTTVTFSKPPRQRRVSALAGCLTTASFFADLHHGRCWLEEGSGPTLVALR